jgi:hypothetical protein
MTGKRLGGPAWALCAAVLLSAGFLGSVHAGTAIALAHAKPEALLQVQTAFVVYARVVLVKGLLPALLVALLLWPLLDRGGRFSGRGRAGLALGLAIAAMLASVAIAAALLPLTLPGLPPVTFTGALNFARTCAEMTGAVMLAAWIPRSVSKRSAAWITVGFAVVFVTGWVAKSHWARLGAPQLARIEPSPPAPSTSQLAASPQASPEAAPASGEARRLEADPEAEHPGWEEIERRRAAAARIRKWIEAGPNATDPPIGGGLLAEGDPHPVYENGELLGVELQNLRPDGFYTRLGLREGDLVQSINGIGLGDSGALLQEIAGSRTIELSIERVDGSQDRISVPREQLLEGLKSLE